ncbi:MAG: hypothetical protein ACREP5_07655 [Candidatus Binatia bacterium]
MKDNKCLRLSTPVIAGFLKKFAKHLALLACLMILGRASGRVDQGQLAIFLIVAAAALFYCVGNHFERSRPPDIKL